MKICRVQTSAGSVCYASHRQDGTYERLQGELLTGLTSTGETVAVSRLLAPLEPAAVLCIGLNYRKHAEEGKQAIPAHPVLFMKTATTVQNPGDPIVLPRRLRSDKVDYECELAVVIGKRFVASGPGSFRWTPTAGLTFLPEPQGVRLQATAASRAYRVRK